MEAESSRRFDRALATLFCIAGGLVGWTEVLPALASKGWVSGDFFFLASFILVVCWTLLQVMHKPNLNEIKGQNVIRYAA